MKGKNGNTEKSLKAFIQAEYRNLVKYVRRSINEKYYQVDAEDIVQDVAVNLFSKLDFDGQLENMAAYVYRSIKNRIADFMRKKKKEYPFETFVDEDGEEFFSENIGDIPEYTLKDINDQNFYKALNNGLQQLSPNQQMVFIATEMDGYTFEDLSEKLNIPIGTLLSWKFRGVKKLKQIIRLDDFYTDNENE